MQIDTLSINLNRSEALVLFDWLSVFTSNDEFEFEHPADEIVLLRILGFLERSLREPWDPRYRELLASARKDVANAPPSELEQSGG